MSEFRQVSPEEFAAFLAAYPRPLKSNVSGMYDPPLVTFNDFTLGSWPDSVVASYMMGWRDEDPPTGHRVKAP